MKDDTEVTVLLPGEFYAHGIQDVADVLYQAGRRLDKACVEDICGECLFKTEDGQYFTLNVEAIVVLLAEKEALSRLAEADT